MPAQLTSATVTEFKMLTPTVFQLDLDPRDRLGFRAGQFLSVIIPAASTGTKDLRRAYSIASHPENPRIELCVKIVEGGPGTTYLKGLRPGDSVKYYISYGDFTWKTLSTRQAVFIATGTGIAPFRSIVKSIDYIERRPARALCLFGVRNREEVLYEKEFQESLGESKYIVCLSGSDPDWNGFRGRVTDYLRTNEIVWADTDFYLCGSSVMIDEVKKILESKGVSKKAIFQEIYYKS